MNAWPSFCRRIIVTSHRNRVEDRGTKTHTACSHTHIFAAEWLEVSETGALWWWMGCIYFLRTAGLQSGHRDRVGHWSMHTLAPFFNLCMFDWLCVCVRALMHILADLLPLPLTMASLLEDFGPHSPFPSAPAPPFCPSACRTDSQSCHCDGWLCA